MKMKSEKVTFQGASGHKISARLDLPETGALHGLILFAHCFTCSKNLNSINYISQAMVQEQFGLFRFDFTGLGDSEGDFSETNFSSNIKDLIAAAKFMEQEYMAPTVLMGHSLGGAAALAAAQDIPSLKAIATLAAPYDPFHVSEHFKDHLDTIEQEGQAEVDLSGRKFTIKQQFIEDISAHNLKPYIENLKVPLMIFHSPTDTTVGIENAKMIFQAAKHPKSFISLDNADHLLLDNPKDGQYVGQVLASWVHRYLE